VDGETSPSIKPKKAMKRQRCCAATTGEAQSVKTVDGYKKPLMITKNNTAVVEH